MTGIYYFMAEGLAVGFTSFTVYIIRWIKDPDAPLLDGIIFVAILGVMMTLQLVFRNQYMFIGYVWGTKIRKSVFASILNKITKLSMRSMSETNSGKLITILNADIQQIERALTFIAPVFIAPILNLIAYMIIWK